MAPRNPHAAEILVLGGVLFASGIAIAIYVGLQPVAIRSTGRPEHQPRLLRAYDSWQAVIFGAASGVSQFRERLCHALNHSPIEGMRSTTEQIGYRVLDEPVHREQIVITARRGIIYCQVYEFGRDLYVGWQSFLNRGRWSEVTLGARGIDRSTRRRVEVRSVTAGVEALCEYDYADVNCLTEWTHAQIVTLTRQLLKEQQIEQEIDFKIVRGDRSQVPESGEGAEPGEKKKPALFKRKA